MSTRDGLAAECGFAGNADDTSGAGRHGVVHGASLTQDRFGRPNHAYHFDGAGDYIEVAPPPVFDAETMSVLAWARYAPRDFRGWTNCIVAQDDGADIEGQPRRVFQLSTDNGHIVWHRMICLRDPMCRRRVRAGVWCHVAAVHDHGEHRLYVDGVLCDTVAHEMWTHDAQPMHIGRKGTDEPFFFFHGDIDDVRVYARALSSDEVLEGRAKHHETGEPVAWAIEGTLDAGEITVIARFNGYSGNFLLTRRGSRLRWSADSIRSHLEALLFPLRRHPD